MSPAGNAVKVLAMLALAVTAVACGDLLGTSHDRNGAVTELGAKGDTGKGTRRDTSTKPDTSTKRDTGTTRDTTKRDTTKRDTTTKPDSGTRPDTGVYGDTATDARITGTVIGIDSTVTPFIELGPIAKVRLTLFSVRYVVDSSRTDSLRAAYDSVAVTTSSDSGTFEFRNLTRGIYLLRALPPAASGYRPGEIGTSAWSPRDFVPPRLLRFYLHKN